MIGKFHYGWIIRPLRAKGEDGILVELADLGNGKHMLVATDVANPIATDTYHQAGFGPFALDNESSLDDVICALVQGLIERRATSNPDERFA